VVSDFPYDFEIRFTAAGGKALIPSAFGGKDYLINVPFELWNIGINTPDNTADDYRLFPNIMDEDNSASFNLLTKTGTDTLDINQGGPTHSISGGDNDPFTDWFYWVRPVEKTPGQAGYNAIVSAVQTAIANGQDPYLGVGTDGDVLRRMVIVGWNMGAVATGPGSYAMLMPEVGTVFRIFTLAGTLVRSVDKNDTSPIWTWDLKNDHGAVIAPGMYIIYVDMPEVGIAKTLKLGIITRQ